MSAVQYRPELFLLERAEQVSARLGELILGESHLGATASEWVEVPAATFSMSTSYTPDENATLIYDSESATVALSWYDTPERAPLYPGDRVRASYAGRELFLGTVDTTSMTYSTAVRAGVKRRVDFTATVVSSYAAALATTVCWQALPEEPAITRLRRWVTVTGWPA